MNKKCWESFEHHAVTVDRDGVVRVIRCRDGVTVFASIERHSAQWQADLLNAQAERDSLCIDCNTNPSAPGRRWCDYCNAPGEISPPLVNRRR